jgi:hypothetical protein
MQQRVKKILWTSLRWGIAVAGIWIVVWNMTLRDGVLLLDPQINIPQPAVLTRHAEEDARQFDVIDPATGKPATVERARIINPPTQKTVKITLDNGQTDTAKMLGMRLLGDINSSPTVEQILVQPTGSSQGKWITPAQVVGGFRLSAPRPRVTVGIITMCRRANPWLLVLSIVVFPITFIITSYRWNKLLEAVDIRMGLARAFIINMVGAFYNTFLLGSTGGDVVKAYYAARQTPHRIRAVMSVFIDRVLGLLALVMVGGVMAAYQYLRAPSLHDPTSRACFQVALACVGVMVGVGLMLAVLFQPTLRHFLGLEFILARLPLQRQLNSAREVMRMYRRRPILMLWALLVTAPVHLTVIVSALLAGKAFGLKIQPLYYFTVVPVVVLAGSIPISPQGAGVMEAFAYLLTQKQGATVNEAVALTMSIRVVQILWNLTGGIFVFRGGYHAPTETEQHELRSPEGEMEEFHRGDAETAERNLGQGDKVRG